MDYIAARRKDGTLAKIGDRVLLIAGKLRIFGTILSYEGARKFAGDKDAYSQTYKISCDDRITRPCRAQSIKGVYISKFSMKGAN